MLPPATAIHGIRLLPSSASTTSLDHVSVDSNTTTSHTQGLWKHQQDKCRLIQAPGFVLAIIFGHKAVCILCLKFEMLSSTSYAPLSSTLSRSTCKTSPKVLSVTEQRFIYLSHALPDWIWDVSILEYRACSIENDEGRTIKVEAMKAKTGKKKNDRTTLNHHARISDAMPTGTLSIALAYAHNFVDIYDIFAQWVPSKYSPEANMEQTCALRARFECSDRSILYSCRLLPIRTYDCIHSTSLSIRQGQKRSPIERREKSLKSDVEDEESGDMKGRKVRRQHHHHHQQQQRQYQYQQLEKNGDSDNDSYGSFRCIGLIVASGTPFGHILLWYIDLESTLGCGRWLNQCSSKQKVPVDTLIISYIDPYFFPLFYLFIYLSICMYIY